MSDSLRFRNQGNETRGHSRSWVLPFALCCLALCCLARFCHAQTITSIQRGQAQEMLQYLADDVKKNYYDPKLNGLDWDAKVKETKEKIDKADSMNRALSAIASATNSFNDSHTFFLPPGRPYKLEYGFRMRMIGDHCYVIHVKPGSDAEKKSVKVGDEVLSLNGYTPTRQNFWQMEYVFNLLRPQQQLQLDLRSPEGAERKLNVEAKMRQLTAVRDLTTSEGIYDYFRELENQDYADRVRYIEKGKDLIIVHFPAFELSYEQINSLVGKMRDHNAAILDLRGDPGGSEEILIALLSGVLEEKKKVFDRVTRKSTKPVESYTYKNGFSGKLVVLVDSNSASCSEIFARVVQLEKRGTVMGDLSEGAVMEARHFSHEQGADTVVFYGASITHANLIMTDGKSLEHVGVAPDTLLQPTAADLAADRDPVMAKAAESLGVQLSAEEAGKLFPYEWPLEAR
jgi:carboxyl-terminal processing protease